MPQPITWRNVDSPGLGVPGQSLLGAQQSINGAFDAFQNILRQQGAVDARNFDSQQEGAKAMFVQALQRAKTPEELAALQASGQLDQLRSNLDANSRIKVVDAEDRRLADIRQGMVVDSEFAAAQRAAREAPIRDRIATLTAQGKTQEAADLLASSGISNQAPLASQITTTARNNILQSNEDIKAANQRKLEAIKVDDATRTAADAEQLRKLQAEVAKMAEDRRNAPPPDLKAAIKEAMRTGKPVADLTPDSDTVAADKAFAALEKSGKYSAQLLAAQRDNIRGSFATNGLSPLVGKDATARDEAAARTQAAFEEAGRSNWYAPGSPNAMKNYAELAKDPYALFNNTGWGTGLNAKEDVADVQALLHRLATQGLEVEKGVFVTPSVNDVTAAIRQAEGSWFRDKTRADNIEAILKKQAESSLFKQQLKSGESLANYQREQRVREILKGK